MATSRACAVGGCISRVHARGWCIKHYTRWARYGEAMTVKRPSMKGKVCESPSCDRQAFAKLLCVMHYHRLLRHGDATVVLPRRPPVEPKPCSVDGCERWAVSRGWCKPHYKRWRRHGTPIGASTRTPAEDRFWIKVNKAGPIPTQAIAPGPCWQWTASVTPGGYGQFRPDYNVAVVAHRYSYELIVGPIPDGLQLDHLCRNRRCVNPAHLELVTQVENIRRGFSIATTNRLKTACPAGHPYDMANTYIQPSNGGRRCRECARIRNRRSHPMKKAQERTSA